MIFYHYDTVEAALRSLGVYTYNKADPCRMLVVLLPDEAQPLDAPDGFRLETDAEFRSRLLAG